MSFSIQVLLGGEGWNRSDAIKNRQRFQDTKCVNQNMFSIKSMNKKSIEKDEKTATTFSFSPETLFLGLYEHHRVTCFVFKKQQFQRVSIRYKYRT